MRAFSFKTSALKALNDLPVRVQNSIENALERLAASNLGDVKKLHGVDEYRLRCGDYRVRFEYLDDGGIRVLQVKHRREAYRQ